MPNLPTLPEALVDALGPSWPGLLELVEPSTLVPVWATVDLDRAAASIAIASRSTPILEAPLLGARVRVIGLLPGAEPPEILVAEPATEGSLAAFLARHGEGWAAVYVLVDPGHLDDDRIPGGPAVAGRPGPFGHERLIAGSASGVPFILIAERRIVRGA